MEKIVTNVPPGQVNFTIALLNHDGFTQITKQPTGDTFTIIGRKPGAVEAVTTVTPPPGFGLSEEAAAFMVGEEAFVPFRYQDVAGNATIGYGHHKGLSKAQIDAQFPEGLTEAQAFDLFLEDAGDAVAHVKSKVTVELAQHMVDALVMFAFQVGNINRLVDDVNAGNHAAVAEKIAAVRTAGGRFNRGVAERTAAVAALYLHGVYPTPKRSREKLRESAIRTIERKFPDSLNTVGNRLGEPTEPVQLAQAKEAYFRMTGKLIDSA